MTRLLSVLILIALSLTPSTLFAQSSVLQEVADEGYFQRCAEGQRRGCSLYTRLVALRLNPQGLASGWGWLSKAPGETQHDGFSEDAIVFTNDDANTQNVVDIIGAAGSTSARPGWSGFVTRRKSNKWVKPVALSAEDMEYLKPGSARPPTAPPNPPQTPTTPTIPLPPPAPPVDLTPILDRLARIEAQLTEHDAHLTSVESTVHAAAQSVLEVKNFLANPPAYKGRILGQSVTLTPQK